MNILSKIKQNWKNILLIFVSILYVGSCTSNCSHKNELRLCKSKIEQCDSIINDLNHNIDLLNHQIDLKNTVIEQKQMNVESLERTAKRNIVNVVKIDTTQLKH